MDAVGLIKFTYDFLPRSIRLAQRGGRQISLRWRERHQPLDQRATRDAAFSVLAGQIEESVAFRSVDSKRTLIAVVRRHQRAPFEQQIHLLEEFGQTYRPIWSSGDLMGLLEGFEVVDVDGDGNKEIVSKVISSGTGGGTRTLAVYSHRKRKLSALANGDIGPMQTARTLPRCG